MELLILLAASAGAPCSKEELIEHLWGDSHVSDGLLKHLIWELRQALGDDAKQPKYIETIPRKGYRMVAQVDEIAAPARRSRRVWVVSAALLTILVAFWFVATRTGDSPVPAVRRWQSSPLTSMPGSEIDPALSPDGSLVAFAWNPEDPADFDIYWQRVADVEPVRLTSHPGADSSPTWSPDGQTLAFVRSDDDINERGIFLLSIEGGVEQRLVGEELAAVRDLVWSPAGDWLVVSARRDSESRFRIFLVSCLSGELESLSQPPATARGDFDPVFSPDGERVAFRRSEASGVDDVYLISRDGGAERRLTTDHAAILGLAWSADGKGLVFSSDRIPPRGLWRLEIETGGMEWLAVPGGFVADPTVAMSGNRLVYQNLQCDSNIWSVGTESGPRIVSTRQEYLPRYSPDAEWIAFLSDRSGKTQIWVSRPDGTEARFITSLDDAAIHSFQWSPSSEKLIFDARLSGRSDLYLVRLVGGSSARLTTGPHDEVFPSWSADGMSVYFGSHRAGSWQIWQLVLESGETVQITTDGGLMARAESQSRYLYVVKRDRAGLWRLGLDDGKQELVVADLDPLDALNWELTDDAIYYLSRKGQKRSVIRFDLATGESQELAELEGSLPYPPGLAVSPDGQTILWTRLDSAASDLILVDPFL